MLVLCPTQQVNAALIERTLSYALGPVNGSFGQGQTLMGVGTFFADDPFVIGVGDTLIFDVLFDSRLQVFDFRDPVEEYFSFGLDTVPGSPGFGGTWISSIEALGARGDIRRPVPRTAGPWLHGAAQAESARISCSIQDPASAGYLFFGTVARMQNAKKRQGCILNICSAS